MSDLPGLEVWAQYGGFAGLISAVLFYILWSMLKEHKIERREWKEDHKQDRLEWKSDAKAQNENMVRAIEELTTAIKIRGNNDG